MADLQSKMNAHQQDIDRAKEQIHDTTQKADSYLTELTKRVEEYETNHSDFEPAGQYLKSALDASRSATQKLKTQGQDLSERSVPVAIDGMNAVQKSLDDLQKQAVAYDDKYAGSRGQQAMDTLHHWVNAGCQRATDTIETTNEQLTKLRDAVGNMAGQATHGAQVAVGEAARVAEYGDEKLGVSTAAGGVVQKVRDLDARLGVSATAAKVDTKITGGLGCKVASTTVDIVTESVTYISETLHNAKLAAQQSDTAQSVEAKGATAAGAAASKKDEVQKTFSESFEKGKDKVGMATQKTEEKAGEVKDVTAEKTEHAKEKAQDEARGAKGKAGEMTESAKEKAGQTKETLKHKAGEAAETAKNKVGMAKDKTGETVDQAKEKSQEKVNQGTRKVGDAKDKTQEEVGESKEQSKGIVGQAADKASDLKEKAKEKVGSAADTAKGMGTRTEAKTTKPKEPTLTQEQTDTEKGLEAAKQTRAKGSEAAKTAAGTAHKELHDKHAKLGKIGGERETPGFKEAQQHASKSSK
ncbi:uncharacterized protein PITG_05294 [Phytophthora infestans T30-4]|uniref:Uncharacterized protein n=1 Tax=Phytophthora infestans (strain T30-4) TaxID=403677 RepID=D0N405_PHYIT|nr:uncharacterized protein PITG_05294 [Phytophthora infestans T30-4]EEY69109.1 conserved hypothetical protein [Phytophthora infestans T30-4]KAI9990165.1 hypothetical protein PInf_020591 [Phytophthora infestans]|eukprot:XP_002998963.1 conserved hypothetical protein [Phytophthora infestans T30-4]